MRDLLQSSAVSLARYIRSGELSSRELVETQIRRVRNVDAHLNALVAERFDAARAEADAADCRLAREGPEGLPPFYGVPCTIKESFALTGMPNSAGLVARRHLRATEDAVAVGRLRAAGAIPLGVTNTSELCMWLESNNRLYGRTGNAYDRSRIAGGSSGGEGALVGSGASPFGLGSDVAGSIRLPAFFNGVFGHKPSGGLVPGTGQFPITRRAGLRYLTTGPLCRRAEDLMPLLRVLAGPDGRDEGCRAFELEDPTRVELGKLHVLDVRGNGLSRVRPELRAAQGRAALHLERAGACVSPSRIPALKRSFEIWAAMMTAAEGSSRFRGLMRRRGIADLVGQLALWTLGRSPHTFPALALALLEGVGARFSHYASRCIARGQRLKEELLWLLGDHGVMLFPSFVRTAPRHRRPVLGFPAYALASGYMGLINVMEFPSTQVPLGFGADGMPLGVQVVSRPGNDHLTIAVALELERAFGGWTPPREMQKE